MVDVTSESIAFQTIQSSFSLEGWDWGSPPLFHLEQLCFYLFYMLPFQVSFGLHKKFLSQKQWI